jgi:hypothetical protein
LTIPLLGFEISPVLETWLSLVVGLIFLITAALRLVTVLIQVADSEGRLRLVSGTLLGALIWTVALPGRSVQELVRRSRAWSGVFHPVGFLLAFGSAVLAWFLTNLPELARWSTRASWVLATGLVAYVACVVVVSYWAATPPELKRLRERRNRVAERLATRIRSSALGTRQELNELRAVALTRIDAEIVPPFTQLLGRGVDMTREIAEYRRSSTDPHEDVLARLSAMRAQYEEGTARCAQLATDAEAHLFTLLQGDDVTFGRHLRVWINDLDGLTDALARALTVPPWPAPEPSEPVPPAPFITNGSGVPPQPPDLERLIGRALRSLNQPGTLAKSGLISLLPRSLRASSLVDGGPPGAEPTPLELGQALRTSIVQAIERLRVDGEASPQAVQYDVLRMLYVLGMTVTQVGIRLSVAEPTVFRRRADGVNALANELWHREHSIRVRPKDAVGS